MGSVDFAHDGEIKYSEFIAATLASQQRLATGSSILAAFNTLDFDHDGYITRQDLHEAFSGQLDAKVCDKLLHNRDDSGRVNFESFKQAIVSLLTESNGKDAADAQGLIDALSPKRFSSRSKDKRVKETTAAHSVVRQ